MNATAREAFIDITTGAEKMGDSVAAVLDDLKRPGGWPTCFSP